MCHLIKVRREIAIYLEDAFCDVVVGLDHLGPVIIYLFGIVQRLEQAVGNLCCKLLLISQLTLIEHYREVSKNQG